MAIRGETIGVAYVRILADGKGLPAEIRRELKDAEPGVSEAGAEHSKAYEKGWEKQSKRNKGIGKNIKKDIDRAFGEIQADADFLSRGLEKDLSDAITNGLEDSSHSKQARQLGDRIAKNITDAFARTGTIHFSVSREIDKALGEIRQEADDFEKAWRRDFDRINTSTERTIKDINSNLGGMGRSLRGLGDVVTRFRIQLAKDVPKAFQGFDGLNKKGDRLRLFSDNVDRATDKFGRAFGKGSRNDAVNFFGSIVSGLINIVDVIPRTILKISEMGSKMKAAFAEGGGGISGFTKAAAPLAANVAVLVGALVVMVAIAGPVTSLLFGLAGGILAVASALAFAAAGALGVIGALMLPLAGAVGVLALAFTGLSDKMKATLKDAFAPMKEELGELQKIAAKGVFAGIKDSAGDFAEAFKGLRPLVRGISGALGDVIRGFGDAVNSPGMKDFIKTMEDFLPGMIRKLGEIFTNVVGGFGGLFAAALPLAQEFLEWFERVTGRFTKFANSKEGQEKLKDFFDKAGESARKVWHLVTQVWDVLKKLLGNEDGRKAGGGILDDMSDSLEKMSDWLDAHPDALKDFFKNGQDTMRDVGNLIKNISKVLDDLDTPEHRAMAHAIFGAIGTALKIMGHVADFAVNPLYGIVTAFDDIVGAGKAMGPLLRAAFAEVVGGFLDMVGDIVHGAALAFGWLPGLGGKLKKADQQFQIFAREADAAIRGITNHVDVNVRIAGGKKAIDDLAAVRWEIDHIPKSVTVGVFAKIQHMPEIHAAAGGFVTGPTRALIGEDGPEAIVPLNRPLSQVDPAVRALSAIAQGIGSWSGQDSGRGGVNVGGLTIITPTEDPRAVARETINRLAAASY